MEKERGFFLIETIAVSMLLLSIAAFCFTYQRIDQQRIYTEAAVTAYFLAQEQIALIEMQPAEVLRSQTNFPWLGQSPLEFNGQKFSLNAVLSPEPNSDFLRRITVTISWGKAQKKHVKSYQKLIAYDT